MPGTMVTLRHGQSTWNLENLFTGWRGHPLTAGGEAEAVAAGRGSRGRAALRHVAPRCSCVPCAYRTSPWPRWGWSGCRSSATGVLNERHYGALQGLDKKQTAERHGAGQVELAAQLRRAAADRRPEQPQHPANDWRYRRLPEVLPASECLADVVARVLPYWHDVIAPQLLDGLDVLVTAHGNSLRPADALEGVTSDEIPEVNIPTGVPRRYQFDDRLGVVSAEYLGVPARSPPRPPPSPPRAGTA